MLVLLQRVDHYGSTLFVVVCSETIMRLSQARVLLASGYIPCIVEHNGQDGLMTCSLFLMLFHVDKLREMWRNMPKGLYVLMVIHNM
jgi:hypothetical protein